MPLSALLYKAWRISIRHYFQSLIFIILPLIFPILYSLQNSQSYNYDSQSWDQGVIIYNKTFKHEIIDESKVLDLIVVYCPNNELTDALMRNVGQKLRTAKFIGLKTEKDIEKWFMNNTKSDNYLTKYGVVFNVKESDVRPPLHFKYTIRYASSSIPTNILFPIIQYSGPLEAGDAYFHEGFLALNIAINDAILNKIGVNEKNWTMQEFPYPSHKRSEESKHDLIAVYHPLIIACLFLYTFTSVVSLSSNEKSSGILERMRMFGMSDFMLTLSYVLHVLLTCTFSTLLMTILLKIHVGAGPYFDQSNAIIVWIVLLMFCIHSTCYFIAVSSIFNSSTFAIFVSSLFFYIPFTVLISNNDLGSFPIVGQALTSLLPLTYFFWAFQNIFGFESVGQGSNFNNIFKIPVSGYCDIPLVVLLLMSVLGCIIFSLIHIYVINVKPGSYGYAKPWNFIFPKKICACFKVTPSNILKNEVEYDAATKGLYERVPDNVEVGLKIVNLHKKFGSVIPIKDLSMDVYVGQITALLGHNGAGKTTTLSIISGIFSPTSGSVFYRGYNIFTNLKAFRYELGLCPQENMLLNDLSAWEHLIFFGMLKGIPLKELLLSAKSALADVNLLDKKDTIVCNLSGGMKRKLCLALALIGSPKVIILDEPSSGLDPESRREIWDILLKLRENRIMIITTHFMEEADALGDQIAIMDHGEIKCYGTPMFLKKHYGTGYQVTVCSSKPPIFNDIIEYVTSKISSATVLNKTEDSIVFNISSSCTGSFPDLFEALETKEEFHVSRIGINCTSMEDVFLKVGEEAGNPLDDLKFNGQDLQRLVRRSDVVGRSPFSSFFQRVSALMVKNIIYLKEVWFSYLLMVIFFPVLIAYWTVGSTNTLVNSEVNNPTLSFKLETYESTEVLLAGNRIPEFRNSFKNLIKKEDTCVDINALNQPNIIQGLLFSAKKDELKFRKSMIIAADFSDYLPNVLYSSIAIHSPPIAVNLLYNLFLTIDPIGKKYSISTDSHPFISTPNFCTNNFYIEVILIMTSWTVLAIALGGVIGHCFIKNPHVERTTLMKHLQLMTNLSPLTYWLSFFLWNLIVYCFCVVLILITLTSFDNGGLLSPSHGAGVVFLIMFLFGISAIWMAYCFSYIFKTSANSFNLFYTGFIVLVVATLITFNLINNDSSYIFIVYIMRLIPVSPFVSAIQKFTLRASYKLQCNICPNAELLPNCPGDLEQSYFDSELNKELYFLGLDWIIYIVIILLIELDYFSKLWNLLNSFYIGLVEESDLNSVESDVAKEKDRVDAALHSTDNDGALTLIVDSLAKKYSPTLTAVQDVTFATKEGECFGLLGVNGAGKSTTFNILTGVQVATQGNVIVKGYNIKENKRKCLSFIGYCPQQSALIKPLTGRQMLTLFANLRLAHTSDVKTLVNQWISLLGLEEYSDRPCGTYSGGNQRKLSTALAFINNPAIILLDEPTSGVDPVTRRKLWIVLKECQNKKQTVIISSHSMDECEAVCDRLTIMAQGYMQCIGNVQHLKSLYGQGFVILIKLKTHLDEDLIKLKEEMLNVYNPNISLKDEHMVMLHYHISEPTFKVSALFAGMNTMKEKFEIIDDYSISDSSLEQVFLSFAKKSDEN